MAEYVILSAPLREELKSLIREVLAEGNGNGNGGNGNGHSREPTELLKLKEAAKRLNQSESWLYRRWKELGGRKLGGNIQFSATDIEKFIAKRGA
jgi:predicted DNA-binding transcriptional regulator AlpA